MRVRLPRQCPQVRPNSSTQNSIETLSVDGGRKAPPHQSGVSELRDDDRRADASIPWDLNTLMAYMDRTHEPTTSCTCAVTDSLLLSVTPSTLSDVTRAMPYSGNGDWVQHHFRWPDWPLWMWRGADHVSYCQHLALDWGRRWFDGTKQSRRRCGGPSASRAHNSNSNCRLFTLIFCVDVFDLSCVPCTW